MGVSWKNLLPSAGRASEELRISSFFPPASPFPHATNTAAATGFGVATVVGLTNNQFYEESSGLDPPRGHHLKVEDPNPIDGLYDDYAPFDPSHQLTPTLSDSDDSNSDLEYHSTFDIAPTKFYSSRTSQQPGHTATAADVDLPLHHPLYPTAHAQVKNLIPSITHTTTVAVSVTIRCKQNLKTLKTIS